jgi:SAM-dependent methyltransferase
MRVRWERPESGDDSRQSGKPDQKMARDLVQAYEVRDLAEHYADYYSDPIRRWRALGAIDKAANVARLWPDGADVRRVADIGCGEGSVIQRLAELDYGEEFVGFEISHSAIEMAERLSYARPTSFVAYDGSRVPAEDGSFDLAILSHVIEHVEEPRSLLAEARRVARNVFVEVPLELNLRTPSQFEWTDVGHINLYNPLLLKHLCQSAGLHIVAEQVTCPSREIFEFHKGRIGAMKWAIKRGFLFVKPIATRLFTYNGSVLARPVE